MLMSSRYALLTLRAVRLSRLTAYYTASWNALRLQVSERTACSSDLNLLAESAEGLEALVTLYATNNVYDVSLDVRVGPTGGSIDLKVPKARVQGGLYVGTLVGQTGSFNLGDIWAQGRISAADRYGRVGGGRCAGIHGDGQRCQHAGRVVSAEYHRR